MTKTKNKGNLEFTIDENTTASTDVFSPPAWLLDNQKRQPVFNAESVDKLTKLELLTNQLAASLLAKNGKLTAKDIKMVTNYARQILEATR